MVFYVLTCLFGFLLFHFISTLLNVKLENSSNNNNEFKNDLLVINYVQMKMGLAQVLNWWLNKRLKKPPNCIHTPQFFCCCKKRWWIHRYIQWTNQSNIIITICKKYAMVATWFSFSLVFLLYLCPRMCVSVQNHICSIHCAIVPVHD